MLKEENVILLMWNIICIKNELINICICDLEKLKLNIVKIY